MKYFFTLSMASIVFLGIGVASCQHPRSDAYKNARVISLGSDRPLAEEAPIDLSRPPSGK